MVVTVMVEVDMVEELEVREEKEKEVVLLPAVVKEEKKVVKQPLTQMKDQHLMKFMLKYRSQ